MKKLLLAIGLAAASVPAHAALLHLDSTYVEFYRDFLIDDGSLNIPFTFSFDVYGSLTLTEEDAFASPVLTFGETMDDYIQASFSAAPRATDNQTHADFVGAYTRTGKLGTIFLNVPLPAYVYGTDIGLHFNLGVGRNRGSTPWYPAPASQSAMITLRMIEPQAPPNPPVPEPASLAVLGVGALALLRRKRKSGPSSKNIDNS